MKLTNLSFVLLTNLALITGLPAYAADFSFSPAGSQLDSDPINDLRVSPGEVINFVTELDTNGLDAPLTNFAYQIEFDTTELEFVSLTRGLYDQELFTEFQAVPLPLANGSSIERVGVVPVSTSLLLDNITFRVLVPKNDGLPDFKVTLVAANTELGDVRAEFPSFQEISIQPVPEPITMAGIGLAIGFGSFFKRKLSKINRN